MACGAATPSMGVGVGWSKRVFPVAVTLASGRLAYILRILPPVLISPLAG